MRGVAGWALTIWLGGCGAAFASGRHEHWKAVKDLAPGKFVEVQREGQAGLEACRVLSANDSALTCTVEEDPNTNWDSLAGARLVFPRGAVRNVWLVEQESEWHLGRWILIGVEVALLVTACVAGGIEGGLFVGLLELGADAAMVTNPMPPRMRRPPGLERRLIYHAPAAVPASP
jgi:hypothetical protein